MNPAYVKVTQYIKMGWDRPPIRLTEMNIDLGGSLIPVNSPET